MKRHIPILMSFLLLFTFSISASANQLQTNVKKYISTYALFLNQLIAQRGTSENFLISGSYNDLAGPQLQAAAEVATLIAQGEFDACCWVGNTPATYAEFASIDGGAIIAGGSSTTYPKHSGGTATFTTDPTLSQDYNAMSVLLQTASSLDNAYRGGGFGEADHPDRLKWLEQQIIKDLAPLWDELWWAFSYADDSLLPDPILTPEFRNHYAFACVVCFGAGFYDTSRLHIKRPNGSYTATQEYDRIVNLLSPEVHNWMNIQAGQQYPRSINWNGKAPIQLSTGPTWQSSTAAVRGNRSDSKHMYPTHCHGSTELYKSLRPYAIILEHGSALDKASANAAIENWYNPSTTPLSVHTSWASHLALQTSLPTCFHNG